MAAGRRDGGRPAGARETQAVQEDAVLALADCGVAATNTPATVSMTATVRSVLTRQYPFDFPPFPVWYLGQQHSAPFPDAEPIDQHHLSTRIECFQNRITRPDNAQPTPCEPVKVTRD
jgi:hypothetical protein